MADRPLHCILTPTGSAGDVHPFIGVGKRLRQRGHDVTMITNGRFRDASEKAGLRFVEHGGDDEFEEVLADANLWRPLRGLRLIMRMIAREMRRQYELISQVYEPGRSIVIEHTLSWGARVFEEKHGAPAAMLHIAPMCFRSLHEVQAYAPGWTATRWPRWAKRLCWWLGDRLVVDPAIESPLNEWRAELGLPPVRRPLNEWIQSPGCVIGLFPSWFGAAQPDWPANTHLTGFPLFDEAGQHDLPAQVEAFLRAGEPPIVFTPGSAMRHGQRFFATAIEAAARLGRRALLMTRYRDTLPATLGPHVMHVPYAPFSELLPRCAAIVHHGGVGTCAQALAAGVPQLVMPMGFDQPDNVTRLWRLGVGRWVTRRRFRPRRVAKVLRELLDSPQVAVACRVCAERIADTDPIEQTCDLIEQTAGIRLFDRPFVKSPCNLMHPGGIEVSEVHHA